MATKRRKKAARDLTKDSAAVSNQMLALLLARSQGSRVYLVGTIMGITVGSLFCIAGFILAILGLNGNIEWLFEASSFWPSPLGLIAARST